MKNENETKGHIPVMGIKGSTVKEGTPKISLEGMDLVWGTRRVHLGGQPQQYRFFSLLLGKRTMSVNRAEIVQELYGSSLGPRVLSKTWQESKKRAAVKQVSRSRRLLTNNFGKPPVGTSWLPCRKKEAQSIWELYPNNEDKV